MSWNWLPLNLGWWWWRQTFPWLRRLPFSFTFWFTTTNFFHNLLVRKLRDSPFLWYIASLRYDWGSTLARINGFVTVLMNIIRWLILGTEFRRHLFLLLSYTPEVIYWRSTSWGSLLHKWMSICQSPCLWLMLYLWYWLSNLLLKVSSILIPLILLPELLNNCNIINAAQEQL